MWQKRERNYTSSAHDSSKGYIIFFCWIATGPVQITIQSFNSDPPIKPVDV
jgi:hypothetical protein